MARQLFKTTEAVDQELVLYAGDTPAYVSAEGLTGEEVVSIEYSQDNGATFKTYRIEGVGQVKCTADGPIAALVHPFWYRIHKDGGTGEVTCALHDGRNP